MAHKQPTPPARPVAVTDAELTKALIALLKSAVEVGKGTPGAVEQAKRARARYDAAFTERLRSERAQSREWSINGINAALGGSLNSANARGPGAINWPSEIQEALSALRKATW